MVIFKGEHIILIDSDRKFINLQTGKIKSKLWDVCGNEDFDNKSLIEFLIFGFVTEDRTLFENVRLLSPGYTIEFDQYEDLNIFNDQDEKRLIDLGNKVLNESIKVNLERAGTKKIVVPLSGGYDSRAILAYLLLFLSPKEIDTYTFGTPGSYDYELGNLVAKRVGTNHRKYNLNRYDIVESDILDIALRNDGSTDLFEHAPVRWIEQDYDICRSTFWIGFLGETSSGSHLPPQDLKNEQYGDYVMSKYRHDKRINIEDYLPIKEEINDISKTLRFNYNSKYISSPEIWDLTNFSEKKIVSGVLLNGFNYITPFTYPSWLSFALSLSGRFRQNQLLYKNLLFNKFPDLFSIPTKTNNYNFNTLNLIRKNMIRSRVPYFISNQILKIINKKKINYFDQLARMRQNNSYNRLIRHSAITFLESSDFDLGCSAKEFVSSLVNVNGIRSLTLLSSLYFIKMQQNGR